MLRSSGQNNGAPHAEQNRSAHRFVRSHFGHVREVTVPAGGTGGMYIGAKVGAAAAKSGPFIARAAIVRTSPTMPKMAIPTVSAW